MTFYFQYFEFFVKIFLSVFLVLQPRRFKYKSRHKLRKLSHVSNFKKDMQLNYGQVGLLISQPVLLSSRHIFRIKIFLNRSAKRSEDTRRKVWLNTFPHWPLTRKPIGSRMGKGVGKLKTWLSYLPTGTIFLEFKNLRIGRSFYFIRQLRFRLKCSTKPIFNNSFDRNLPLNFSRKRVSYQSFW